MSENQEVLQTVELAIFQAIDEINLQRPKPERLEKTPETSLMSEATGLDSLELITLFVTVEQALESRHGLQLSLAEHDLPGLSPSPFGSVKALAKCIAALAAGNNGSG